MNAKVEGEMNDLQRYYWLTCPSCYKPVKKLYLDYVAYTRCNHCGKVWFQGGKGLPVMSARQQAHYQIEKLRKEA